MEVDGSERDADLTTPAGRAGDALPRAVSPAEAPPTEPMPAEAPAEDPSTARAPAVLVFAVAAGALGAPFLIGAVALLLLGELFVPRVERGLAASIRGHIAFALAGAVLGLAGWLPDVASVAMRTIVALALVPLAYVPTLVHDPAVTWRRALAVSLDLTMRARPRELAWGVVLALFLGPMVSVASFVWHLDALLGNAPQLIRGAILGGSAIAIACLASSEACVAVTRISWSANDTTRHLRAPSRLGMAVLAFSVICLVWLAALPSVMLSSARSTGLPPVVGALPVALERVGAGPLVVMRRHDGAEFGVLAHFESGRWWIDTVDVDSARHGVLRATPLGDLRVASAQLQANVLLAAIVLLLGWLAWARLGWLRRALGRSSVVRVRVRSADVDRDDAAGRATVRAGAPLMLLAEGTTGRVTAPLVITGLTEMEPDDEPREWIDASVIARRPWSGAMSYRDGLPSPPLGARVIAGGPEDAIAAARLDDLERVVVAALALVPALWFATAFRR